MSTWVNVQVFSSIMMTLHMCLKFKIFPFLGFSRYCRPGWPARHSSHFIAGKNLPKATSSAGPDRAGVRVRTHNSGRQTGEKSTEVPVRHAAQEGLVSAKVGFEKSRRRGRRCRCFETLQGHRRPQLCRSASFHRFRNDPCSRSPQDAARLHSERPGVNVI